jgi:hypothetical protein
VTIVGEVPDWVRRSRWMLTPQGEEVTLLPQTIEFDRPGAKTLAEHRQSAAELRLDAGCDARDHGARSQK